MDAIGLILEITFFKRVSNNDGDKNRNRKTKIKNSILTQENDKNIVFYESILRTLKCTLSKNNNTDI